MLNKAFNPAFGYAFDGWKNGIMSLIPTENLELLVDPGATLGLGKGNGRQTEFLGANLIDNGDFHDFTMEDDANSDHYILDQSYSVEDGNQSICSERGGSESLDYDSDFSSGVDGWDGGGTSNVETADIGGEDDTCRAYEDASVIRNRRAITMTLGSLYRIRFKFYVSVGDNVDRIKLYDYNFNTTIYDSGSLTQGVWYDIEIFVDWTDMSNGLHFYANSSPGEISGFYIKDIETLKLPANSLTPSGFSDGFEDEQNDGGSLGSDIAVESKAKHPITDISDWAEYGSNISEIENGAVKISYVDNSYGAYIDLDSSGLTSANLVVGKTYRITFDTKIAGTSLEWMVNDGIAENPITVTNSDWETKTIEITAEQATGCFIVCKSMGSGEVAYIKNIYVQEVYQYNPAYENGGVLEFNGVDTELNGGDIHDITSDFTVEAWIKTYNNSSTFEMIAGKGDSSTSAGWEFFINNAWLYFRGNDGGGSSYVRFALTGEILDGEWHLVAAVRTKSTGSTQLYIDGAAVGTPAVVEAGVDITNSDDFRVGLGEAGFPFGLTAGWIAEVRISNTVRSANDIKESYGLAKSWSWDTVGAISNSSFSQVVSGSGVVSQQVTHSDTLFKENVDNITEYYTGLNPTVSLGDGAYLDTFLKEVLNAETPDTSFVEDFSLGGAKYGAEIDSGTLTVDLMYIITATEVDHFGTGLVVGDYFVSAGTETCDSLNKVKQVTNGNHGMMQNDMEDDQPTHPYALEFDNVDQFISHGNTLDIRDKDIICFAWIKIDDYTTDERIFSKFIDTDNRFIFQMTLNDVMMYSKYLTVGEINIISNGDVLSGRDGEWVFVAIGVKRGVTGQVFIDGQAVATTITTNASPRDVQIATDFDMGYYNTTCYDGKIGMAGVYIFPNGLPSNYATAIIKKIYDNTKERYSDE